MIKNILRIGLVAFLVLVVGSLSGGLRGIIGWFIICWVFWRAWPGLWLDIRRCWVFLHTFRFRKTANLTT